MICPYCKKNFNEEFDYCPWCGSKKPDLKICPNCEYKTYDEEFMFCPECGNELIDEREYREWLLYKRQESIRQAILNERREKEEHMKRVVEANKRKRNFEKAKPMGNWWY